MTMLLKLQKWSRKLWVCRRVDPFSLTIHVFRDIKQLDKHLDQESGVWACKLFSFDSDEKLAEFLNLLSSRHKVMIHFKGTIIQKTQTTNTVNTN